MFFLEEGGGLHLEAVVVMVVREVRYYFQLSVSALVYEYPESITQLRITEEEDAAIYMILGS